METVWVVEKGSYSDYRVVGVFSTQANAQIVADKVNGSVDEWTIDQMVSHIKDGKEPYYIWMDREGHVDRIVHWEYRYFDGKDGLSIEMSPTMGKHYLIGYVYARDETHAVKIANEIRAQYITEGKWPSEDTE